MGIFIFNKELWLKVDRKNYTKCWGWYEFILKMKEVSEIKEVPIIILTTKEGLSDIVKLEGIKEYIMKPFQPETLLKSIQRYI